MRALIVLAAAASLAACARPAEAPSEAAPVPIAAAPAETTQAIADAPRQRPGLWRISTTIPGLPSQTTDICVTPEMSQQASSFSPSSLGDCTPPAIRRDGEALVVTSTCGAGETRSEVITRVTGDFESRMTSEVEMRTAGTTTVRMSSSGTYVGPCPA